MNVDRLHTWVSEAIWRAERLEDQGLKAAQLAWQEVSALEEQIAALRPSTSADGHLARDGAVRAALKAGDPARARELARQYSEDAGVPDKLRATVWRLLEEDEQGLSINFRPACKHHSVRDVREQARWLRQAGAFGLAA